MLAGLAAAVLDVAEEPHPRREEDLLEHLVVVGDDLRGGGPLVEAGVRARLVDALVAQPTRGHAIGRRRLVESDEGVGVEPVAPGSVSPVDEQHLGLCVRGHQGIDEGHARRAGAHHQVVDLDLSHTASSTLRGAG